MEPNEIRQLIKAAADSSLIYSLPGIQASDKKKNKKHTKKNKTPSNKTTNEEGFVGSFGPTGEWRNSSSAAHQLVSEMDRALPSGGVGTLHITAQCGSPQKESRRVFLSVCMTSSLSAFPSVAPQAPIVQLIAQVVYL